MAGLLSEDGLVDGSAHGFQQRSLWACCCYDGSSVGCLTL